MQLIIKRAKEYRHGWSYRAYAWEIELDGKPMGSIRDQETLSFDVPGGEHLLEIWVEKLPRSSAPGLRTRNDSRRNGNHRL